MQSRLRRTISQVVLVGSVLGLGVGTQVVLAAPGTAAVRNIAAITNGNDPKGDITGSLHEEPPHVQHEPLKPKDVPPLSSFVEEQRRNYDAPTTSRKTSQKSVEKAEKAVQAAAACSASDFAGKTGSALVTAVKNATPDCVDTLFGLTGADARAVFGEAQMVAVASALRDNAVAYAGDNSTGTLQLVLYLRAGYYVQSKPANGIGAYGTSLKSAVRSALDAFFANSRSGDVNDVNGETLTEAVILIDSAQENARYIYVVKRLLNAYDSSYNSYKYMRSAVNSVFTVLFRGHYVPEFVSLVQSDPSVLDTTYSFADRHFALISGDYYYLPYNAARELARFVQHSALRAKVRPMIKALIDRSSITGTTARMWIALADMVDYYDTANCSYYGTCDYLTQIKETVLPIRHTCSSSVRILAQDMTTAQLNASCTSMANQDAFFHNVAKDNGPVAGDLNTIFSHVHRVCGDQALFQS